MTVAARLRVVLAASAVLILAGCAQGGPQPAPTPQVTPTSPTDYMTNATQQYDISWTRASELPWKPVVVDGLRWSGDPRTYERVCHANFLAPDGTVPMLNRSPSGSPSGLDDPTWFDQLRADPARWAAFNAWLADPAVIATIVPSVKAENFGTLPPGQIGDYSACPDRNQAARAVG